MLLAGLGTLAQEPIDHVFSVQHYGALASAATAAGDLAIASHPMRQFGQHWTVDELLRTEGILEMEVFSGDGIHVDQDRGFEMWDQVLSSGRRLWGFGNDDFHHWGQELSLIHISLLCILFSQYSFLQGHLPRATTLS